MTDIKPFQGDTADQAPVVLASARGLRNNNPGNIKISGIQWNGQVPGNDPTFATFDTPESGIAALAKNLVAYQKEHGINTIAGLVRRWAPSSDNNNVNAYIKSISEQTGIGPNDKLNLSDPDTLSAIVPAMIRHENGKNPYDTGTVMGGINYALNGINPAKVQWDSGSDSGQPQDLGGVKVQQGTVDPFAGDKPVVAPATAPAPQAPAAQPRVASPAPLAIDPSKVQWDAPAQSGNNGGMSHHYDANGRLVIDDNTPARAVPSQPAPQQSAQGLGGNLQNGLQGAYNLAQGFNHGVMAPLHGIAQMVEHGIQAGANLLPDNPITRYINGVVANDDAALQQQEQAYQNRTQGSIPAGVGDVGGNTLMALMSGGDSLLPEAAPAAPAANTILQRMGSTIGNGAKALGKAGVYGGAVALAQPATDPATNYWLQKADQAKTGVALGAAIPVIGGAAGAAGKTVGYGKNIIQSLIDPLTDSGQNRIALNVIGKFADHGPVTGNSAELIPGSLPTLAQTTGNPGIAQLERGMRDIKPNAFIARDAQNQAARDAHVSSLVGDQSTLGALEQARDTAAMPLLQNAFANAGKANPQGVLDQIDTILGGPGGGRDAVQSVMNNIRSKLVDAQGNVLPEANNPAYLYQTVRKQIGDLLDKRAASANPAGQQASRELLQVRDALDQDIAKAAPGFTDYLQSYADASKPINAQQLLQGLNLTDSKGNYTLAKVQNAINSITKQMKASGANNAKSLSPVQLNALSALRDDLLRQSNTAAGKSIGSNTFQNLATNNILSQALPGPLGSLMNMQAGQIGRGVLGRMGQFVYGNANEGIQNALADALLNPNTGRALNNRAGSFLASQPAQNRLIQRLTPYLVPGVVLSAPVSGNK